MSLTRSSILFSELTLWFKCVHVELVFLGTPLPFFNGFLLKKNRTITLKRLSAINKSKSMHVLVQNNLASDHYQTFNPSSFKKIYRFIIVLIGAPYFHGFDAK